VSHYVIRETSKLRYTVRKTAKLLFYSYM